MLRIAINGFGRIGRLALRVIKERNFSNLKVVSVNDPSDHRALLHLLKYDSVHGKFDDVRILDRNSFDVGLGPIQFLSEKNAENLPWREENVDLVFECSGKYKTYELASKHIQAGAKRVLVSTIMKDADKMVIFGVNHKSINRNDTVISAASCTSNAILSLLSPVHKKIGIEAGNMVSIHSYTSDQPVVDCVREDFRRSRAVGMSMIPSSTNAAIAIPYIFPELRNKIFCSAIRVPVPNVSCIDFGFVTRRNTSSDEINDIIVSEVNESKSEVLGFSNEPLVSSDFVHDARSSIVDLQQTNVTSDRLCRILSWYDNEWGYANRLCDIAQYIFDQKLK